MFHESMDPVETMKDIEILSHMIEGEALRDIDWVDMMISHGEYLAHENPPLAHWIATRD